MSMNLHLALNTTDWLAMFTHFMSLSLLAIGGAITTAPDMHRYLVDEQHWLTDSQFTSSIALAQAAPGPNLLFIAVLGWNVGVNAGGGMGAGASAWGLGLMGMSIAMVGIMLPSTTLTFAATRWAHQNRELRAVRAFKQGMAPIVIALLIATGWILAAGHGSLAEHWHLWLLTGVSALIVWRTKLHLLWLLGAGGMLGWLGWV
ncbi:chromate transporter [Rhodoferax sp.]|uniref:chromate transporter n=1 Tax=Rhodoferax sp. TaxID=50421 RepID=UPI001EB50505|nr:chromate transporter [Rhodoferax sp.]MBT9506931.1 chromate transporter [Rhodoferax sp.]